jgi:hypothetical protein
VLTALLVGATSACGGGGAVRREEFVTHLAEREAITVEQAECVADYVYDAYGDDAVRSLHETELRDLPSTLWSEYAHSMVLCVLGEQLGVAPGADGAEVTG